MTINIVVYSLNKFQTSTRYNDLNVNSYPDDFFICIHATGSTHSIPHFKTHHSNVLTLYFDDVSYDMVHVADAVCDHRICVKKACNKNQALAIVEFINQIPENKTLHVYCTRGTSRSVAIADFARECRNQISVKTTGNVFLYDLLKELYEI